MKKKSLFIVLAALFLLFLLWRIAALIFGGSDNAKRGSGQLPVAVETDSVRYEPIEEIRQFTGSVYPIYQYILAPKVSGRLLSIRKRIGDWVRAGEVVAVIDDAEYQQALREAEANLKIAEASLIEAQSQAILAAQELERVRLLKEKGIAAQAEFDVASSNEVARKSRLELAQAQVEQRQAALKSAQIRLNYTRLTASEPGFVGERFVDEGALLSVNSAVVSVVGIDRVIVRTTIVERDYGRIEVGQAATVHVDSWPGKGHAGLVARIAPVLDEAARVAKMEVEVDNSGRMLKPGMFARVMVTLASSAGAQTVPSKAIVGRDGASGLFSVSADGKSARYVPVEIGIVSGERTEILSPKLTGPVITLGQHLLQDGSLIILPAAGNGASATSSVRN